MDGINKKSPVSGMEVKGKLGKYKLGKRLGKGGNGSVFSVEVVYAKEALPKNMFFVIKILVVDSREEKEQQKREARFRKEIMCIRQIQDEIDGIIPIYDTSYDLEEKGDFDWYLMPKALNYNFKSIHSPADKLKHMRDVGECIFNLHKRKLAHRDIKPKNLLLYKNRVCLSDFGLIWDMNETEDHITEMHDKLGPAAICPPEMREIEKLDDIDYRKSDVYLFVKTVWIVMSGKSCGFSGEYIRSIREIYLDKDILQVPTAEPLHKMLELATKHYYWERIDISDCLQFINDQLNIIDKKISVLALEKWKYEEMAKEVCEIVPADIKVYQEEGAVLEILTKMSGMVNLIFEEAGKTYDPIFLKDVRILPEGLFELDVNSFFYGNIRRKIIIAVENIAMKKDLSCLLATKKISNQPYNTAVFSDINKAFKSMDKQICISGVYTVRFSISSIR